MTLKMHKDLKVWQESKDLVTQIYSLTSKFPKEEIYSITAQIKRAAISVPSNIAEGAARDSNKEYLHFLYIALGSTAELDTQLIIAKDLTFITEKEFVDISKKIDQIGKMLSGLIKYRQSKS